MSRRLPGCVAVLAASVLGIAPLTTATAAAPSPKALYDALLSTPVSATKLPAGFRFPSVGPGQPGTTATKHHVVGQVMVVLNNGDDGLIVFAVYPTRAEALGNQRDAVALLQRSKGMTIRRDVAGVPVPSVLFSSLLNGLRFTQLSLAVGNVEVNAVFPSEGTKSAGEKTALTLARFALTHLAAVKAKLR